MMDRLFGTDGIRGVANEYPLTAEAVFGIGRAIASFFGASTIPPKIIIGKDTRESGDMIEDALAAGICSVGADACLAGILPTPAVAYLVSSTDAAAGIVTYQTHYRIEETGRHFSETSKIRFTARGPLAAVLDDAGLEVGEWLGDWRGGTFEATSREIIPLGRLR